MDADQEIAWQRLVFLKHLLLAASEALVKLSVGGGFLLVALLVLVVQGTTYMIAA